MKVETGRVGPIEAVETDLESLPFSISSDDCSSEAAPPEKDEATENG